MREDLDRHGQPLSEALNWDRRLDRGMDELVGIARGVLADGRLVIEEARFMRNWLQKNEPVRRNYFGRVVYDALNEALSDNELTAEEEDILVGLLLRFVGPEPDRPCEVSYSSELPLDVPPPDVVFAEQSFCFTGKFIFGTRQRCQQAITTMGGSIHHYPIFATNYVIVGDVGSRDWIHSVAGRKIERAIEIRSQGNGIKLIAEQHWICCLADAGFEQAIATARKLQAGETGACRKHTIPATSAHTQPAVSGLPLAGKTIVVTGTLKRYSREEIQAAIQKNGGRASGSVSKKTDYVLAGEEAGSKLDKARDLGVPVISEEEFERLIGR